MSFAKRLKQLRESKGLSQEQLAEILNIPRSTITNYEKEDGDRSPRKERLMKIADYFGVTLDYLQGREEESNIKEAANLLIDNLELSDEEILKMFTFTVDGKPITEEEAKRFVALVRAERSLRQSPPAN